MRRRQRHRRGRNHRNPERGLRSSVDLDPTTPGRQPVRTTADGTFTAATDATDATDATVTFKPADGFSGRATTAYTVADSLARVSRPATITVTVKPPPTPAQICSTSRTAPRAGARRASTRRPAPPP
jgi:hypothetical protein